MEAESQYDDDNESAMGTIIGWGALGLFAIGFGWYVGAPLIIGERWANKKDDAIALVRNSQPSECSRSLYDSIREYSLKMHGTETYIGEFSWDALQREGPHYEVTLLWTEGTQKHVAIWKSNLQDSSVSPQGDAANGLIKRVCAKA